MPKRKKDDGSLKATIEKVFTGVTNIGITTNFESPTVFVVRATLGKALPPDMPEKLRDSMMMAVISESMKLEAARLARELDKEEWKVETHEVDTTEQSH